MRALPFIIACITTIIGSSKAYAIPAWAKTGSQELTGNIFRVVCSGQGPSIDLARREAELSCKASASSKLATSGKVTSTTVETEGYIDFHQEVREQVQYENMTCVPENEEIEEGDAYLTVWIRCRFDLSKVATKVAEPAIDKPAGQKVDPQVADKQIRAKSGIVQKSRLRSVSVASVPPCTDILISGGKPRTMECSGNPVNLILEEDDTGLTIRAKGYMPKAIHLEGENLATESIQVILEKN